MIALFNNLRYLLRQMRRAPGFACIVIVTLALGIGATTVVFSIVDAVLLRPLPFPHAARLVELESLENLPGGATRANDTSYPNFFDWRQQSKSFQSMAAYKSNGYTIAGSGDGAAERAVGIMVSSDFFTTLGVEPVLGRGFRRDEEQAGNRSVVISSQMWRQRFASSPDVLGKTIRLNDEAFTIVGVMPAAFQFPLTAPDAQLWVTTAQDAEGPDASATQRGYNQLSVVGRLKDGIALDQARAELNSVAQGLAVRYPDEDKNMTQVEMVPELESLVGDVRLPLRILFAAVGFLLLIACANAAGLFLTRASSRVGELSIRAALGASRVRILGQLLAEALTLALCGGALGAGLAAAALKSAPRFLPSGLIRAQSVAMNSGVLWFALGAALATGLVFGVLPALRVSRLDPATTLGEGRRGATAGRHQNRLHAALVVAETALSLILLAGAGLLMRSFDRVMHVNPGFDPSHMLTFRIAAPDSHFKNDELLQLFNRIMDRLRALPGVEAVTAAFPMPLAGGNISISFSIEGQPVAKGDEPAERVTLSTAGFFETLRIPIKQGRFFIAAEHSASGRPVVIVNQAFARKYFGSADAVGQHMRSGLGAGDQPPMREIVGVVGDVKRASLVEADKPEYYIPLEQADVAPPAIAMRVSGDPAAYENLVQTTVAGIDRGLPVYRMHPYADDLARITAQQRFQTMLLGSFAAIALLLAGIGLYALLSYMVVLRRPELALRIALGAQRANVLRIILGRGVALSIAGLAIGLGASVLLTRFLSGILFGVKALDPLTFTAVSLLLLAAAMLASLVPALRAARLDPIETLRTN
jgi:putative ABC transport system permease protein